MERKWFVFADQLVRGPLTTQNIEEGLTAGRWSLETLIWWKGQTQWISISSWRTLLPDLAVRADASSATQEWYLESKGNQTGPMTREELLTFLNGSTNPFQYS